MNGVTEFSGAMIITMLVVISPIVGVAMYGLTRAVVWIGERIQDGW